MASKTVTMKSTKQEIYDALVEANKKVKEVRENNFNPFEEAAVKEAVAVVESAKESVQQNLFSEELSKKFTDLEQAIEIKSKELKEMYGIEKELQDITSVVNAGKEFSSSIEAAKKAKMEEYEELRKKLEKEYEDEKEEFEATQENYERLIRQQREREKDEYEYVLKRTREKENDVWNDEKAAREAAVAEKEAKANEMYADAESKLDYIAELEAKVTDIPRLIKEAETAGAEAANKESAREYGYKKTMAEKEHSYEVQRLEDKVALLTTELEKSTALNESLQDKLDNAYEQIRELATKTVESTGGVKIIGNSGADTRK